MKRFADISLKNKFFFTNLVVILIISATIAFLARWILVSTLISELELRGIAIARTIAERGSGYILDKNYPELLALIFDEAKLTERQHLVSYIFITDQDDEVISHTFTRPFPPELRHANPVPAGEIRGVRLFTIGDQAAYDIATPITQGIYRIGMVHVGLNKSHIDSLVAKLRVAFLGYLSVIIIIIFVLSHWLSKYITMPISKLTKISDELSRGNFDVQLDLHQVRGGWEPHDCPAFASNDLPCWHFDQVDPLISRPENPGEELRTCRKCEFYRRQRGDEVAQLADSFYNMIWSIRLYRRRLHESEEKYRSLFDSGPDPIFVVDCSTFEILDANPRAVEVYGYPKSELLGKSFLELGPENTSSCLASFEEEGGSQGSVYYPKVMHYRKGSKPFFVSLHACHISYRERPAIIISSTDISEMIEKDAQLIQASKMKSLGEMSAGIAHELNQPLNAIKMGSDFLAMVSEQNLEVPMEHVHQVVSEISTQVDRAAEIINTLRSFGRKAELVTEKLDINKPIRGVISIVKRQFELENISIQLQLTERISHILAHDNRLQQIFFNLVANARDAINEKAEAQGGALGGTIIIRSYQDDDHVVAEVQDTGVGIPESVRDKIFEPFFSTKETSNDMGLGLAITYGIVQDYGGEIQVMSEEGEGTTFKLSFAAAD